MVFILARSSVSILSGQVSFVSSFQVKNNLLLNNQMGEDKLQSHSHSNQAPLKKIVNNLANTGSVVSDNNNNNSNSSNNNNKSNNNTSCNPCKESQSNLNSLKKSPPSCPTVSHCSSKPRTGVVNLAFVDSLTEQSSWYQPHLPRDLAVTLLADSPVGSFVVRNCRSQSSGCLALSLRVPRSYNTAGVLHYLILVTQAGFRIKGFSKVFSSLSGLVVHHSVMQEGLPCRLIITDSQQGEEEDRESDWADLDTDPEYPGLLSSLREQLSSA